MAITDRDFKAWRLWQAGSKYRAIRVEQDGLSFDSRKEARRYQDLKLLETAGAISALERQPVFPLHIVELYRASAWPISIRTVGRFTADFQYCDLETGEIIIEDVKSDPTKTTAYRLRKRIVEAVHGVTIREL